MKDSAIAFFAGFSSHFVELDEGSLHARVGGTGPPLLLLHGHPQTHAMWHRVAPELACRFTVVVADLRGYGDSMRPRADTDHRAHSKRTMAADLVSLMASLGHRRFGVAAHDRGARVAFRMALDHPACVRRLMMLDIAPTVAMYALGGEAFARAYWHWFFLIQPPPFPERAIEADAAAYAREMLAGGVAGLAPFDPEALAEYERCVSKPGSATSICEDYRASAGCDAEDDRADFAAGRRLEMPVCVLWGERGIVGRLFDVQALWREWAPRVVGRALPCGHYLAEEQAGEVIVEALAFFGIGGGADA